MLALGTATSTGRLGDRINVRPLTRLYKIVVIYIAGVEGDIWVVSSKECVFDSAGRLGGNRKESGKSKSTGEAKSVVT